MTQVGRVIEVNGDKVKIMMKRHTACGDCGACHVAKEKLDLILIADNHLGAKVGDEVEINMQTVDVMSAVFIMYGIPLAALILGIFGGYSGFFALGFGQKAASGLGGLVGFILMGITYMIIKAKESSIEGMKKFCPVIISVRKE